MKATEEGGNDRPGRAAHQANHLEGTDNDDALRHACGIVAVYHLPNRPTSPLAPAIGSKETARLVPRMLLDIQNRGQLSAGLSSYNSERRNLIRTYKDIGTVMEVFRMNHREKAESIMRRYAGNAAIGHVRYATCGADERSYAQPFERHHGRKWKWFTFAFNGQLANYPELRAELLARTDYHLMRDTDTEIIMHAISYELRGEERPDLVNVFHNLSKRFDGSYNIAFLNALGELVVARDPLGIRPLCYAFDGSLFAAASESVALANLGFAEIHSLEPCQMALVTKDAFRLVTYANSSRHAHCFFEWVYFANVASVLDDRSVYLTRTTLGEELARLEQERKRVPLDEDTVVVPVPDTAKAAAAAMGYRLGLRVVEGLMRNRYIGRTFIEGFERREDRAKLKYTPLPEVLEGKRVLLVEDTIVRATTMRVLVNQIRNRGRAKEVHVRVACPPIIAPCFYGIDMSRLSELFATRFLRNRPPARLTAEQEDRMARDLGADSLMNLPACSVSRAIRLPGCELCQACVTGEYPTEAGKRMYERALKRDGRDDRSRTYEDFGR